MVVAVLVVVALVGGVVAGSVLFGGGEADAGEVVLEAAGDPGENPYVSPVGTDEEGVVPPEDGGGSLDGDTPGLYGGTRDEASCDAEQLVAFLEDEPAKAEAWAEVLGIEPSGIAELVGSLTPLVLRSDTAVTNHGFDDGESTSFPAVLQAGTAVLVDAHGEPVVKCGCGNPLTDYDAPGEVSYEGERWAGFEPGAVAVVRPVTVDIDVWYVVDPRTGEAFGRPIGTDGDEDGPAPPLDGEPTTTTEPTGDLPTEDLVGAFECEGYNPTVVVISVDAGTVGIAIDPFPGGFDAPPTIPIEVAADGTFEHTDATGSYEGTISADRAELTAVDGQTAELAPVGGGSCEHTIELLPAP